jgi:hypothetical protein
VVLISYVDDGTIIVQSDMWDKNLIKLKSAYKIVFELTQSMGLVLEHNKLEGCHFQKHGDSNPDIDLGYAPYTGATPLHPGTTWWYLGFFFNHALTFREHVKQYTNKALTTVRAMLAPSNSVRGLWPKHKRMLYHACVLPIATYGSRLWLYEGAAMKGPLDSVQKMQRHACLWITGSFKTSPMGAAKTLAGVPLIHLHVKKLVERSHIHTHTLQASHAFCRLVDGDHKFSIETLKGRIWGDLKSPITEAWLNLDLSSLDLDPVNRFNQPGLRPKDLYHGHIVYDIVSPLPKTDKDHKKFMADQINLLCGSVNAASHSPQHICIVTDMSTPSLPLQSVVAFHLWHEGTYMTTGLQPVFLRLMTPNCEQSQTGSVKPTMLVWRMYNKYMSSPTLQTHSASHWTRLTTRDNTCPYPSAKCWCLGSDTTQITVSTSTTSYLV